VSLVVVSNLFITVHDTIHRPGSHRLLEAQPWFRFLDNHHYIHHVDTEANVNFLLPLADWLFGTLRRSLTAEELRLHGSRQEAKAELVGVGEPARAAASRLRARVAS
jgi:sterol desaturase/sphingolipid hydroxylase (fatty acid hydroxylase superfamily)